MAVRAADPGEAGATTGYKGAARNVVRSFVLVVLPLLLVAAAIEGLVTPLLGGGLGPLYRKTYPIFPSPLPSCAGIPPALRAVEQLTPMTPYGI